MRRLLEENNMKKKQGIILLSVLLLSSCSFFGGSNSSTSNGNSSNNTNINNNSSSGYLNKAGLNDIDEINKSLLFSDLFDLGNKVEISLNIDRDNFDKLNTPPDHPARDIQDKDEFAIVPFYHFYSIVEKDLDHQIRIVFERCQKAANNNDGIEQLKNQVFLESKKGIDYNEAIDKAETSVKNAILTLTGQEYNIEIVTVK